MKRRRLSVIDRLIENNINTLVTGNKWGARTTRDVYVLACAEIRSKRKGIDPDFSVHFPSGFFDEVYRIDMDRLSDISAIAVVSAMQTYGEVQL